MGLIKTFVVIAFAIIHVSDSYPRAPSGTNNIQKAYLNESSSNLEEFFWYEKEDGGKVKAFLSGGPPPATLSEAEEKVGFWLYKNGKEPGILVRPNCPECFTSYSVFAPLVILSHGFTSSHEGGFGETHRNALSQRTEEINVIFVNWEKLAGAPRYDTAASNCNPVGTYTAVLINYMVQQGFTTLDKIHFVGHSLGSHVGNFVGNNVIGGKIARITALDPALPLFGNKDDSQRIDPSDAQFVDVIHTSMGTLLDGGLAFSEPRGHVDFYPNSGRNQPGCGMDAFGACSHGRANSFFAESVANPSSFLACKCNDWTEYDSGRCLCLEQEKMGFPVHNSARGLYYLRTKSKAPFGQG